MSYTIPAWGHAGIAIDPCFAGESPEIQRFCDLSKIAQLVDCWWMSRTALGGNNEGHIFMAATVLSMELGTF